MLELNETSPAVMRLLEMHTCHCGAGFTSRAALDGHRKSYHGFNPPAGYYCMPNNTCSCCLLRFSNRKLLHTHLHRQCTCFLNAVLCGGRLSETELKEVRSHERALEAQREKLGLSRYEATDRVSRCQGPLMPILDLEGNVLTELDKLHPFGPHKRKYLEGAAVDDDDNDDDPTLYGT